MSASGIWRVRGRRHALPTLGTLGSSDRCAVSFRFRNAPSGRCARPIQLAFEAKRRARYGLKLVFDNPGSRIDYVLDNEHREHSEDPSDALRRTLSRPIDALGRVQQTTGT